MEKSFRRLEAERKMQDAWDFYQAECDRVSDEHKVLGLDGNQHRTKPLAIQFFKERDAILLEYADEFAEEIESLRANGHNI